MDTLAHRIGGLDSSIIGQNHQGKQGIFDVFGTF
jgi:hypothetical protein